MGYIKLPTGAGDSFSRVAEKAKQMAIHYVLASGVEFEFNGVICVVAKDTNLDWLWRDYCNAHTMEWDRVGGDCVAEYSAQVQAELTKRKAAEQEAENKRRAERDARDKSAKEIFAEKVKGIEMEISNIDEWNAGKEKNTDPYGACCYEYAEGWAKVMQAEIKAKGYEKVDYAVMSGIAEKASQELDFLGISGFMYGAAVSILSRCWIHGEELRKWHNKEYGREGDGVVNPAILTIGG